MSSPLGSPRSSDSSRRVLGTLLTILLTVSGLAGTLLISPVSAAAAVPAAAPSTTGQAAAATPAQESEQAQSSKRKALPGGSTLSSFPAGTLLVDMGATQTVATGLKPYGFVYEMVTTYKIPVSWAIANGKTSRGAADFTATNITDLSNGSTIASKTFSGSSFVVSGLFTQDIPTARLTYWINQGVKFYRTSSAMNLPEYSQLRAWPRIVLDADSSAVANTYYANAGIPSTAYRSALPFSLTACDDLFVFPHADPTWALHSNLRNFNDAGGYIFAQCKTPSILENIDDPADAGTAPDLNFLSTNGMVGYTGHSDGTPPYTYDSNWSDPLLQYNDALDGAMANGLEQIYFPKTGGWRPSTKVLAWDADHPQLSGSSPVSPGRAAVQVYGRGYGDASNGMVMYEASHSFTGSGTTAAQVAAQRAFLNFNLMAGIDRGVNVTTNVPNAPIAANSTIPVKVTASGGSGGYTYKWTSSCGGTFADSTAASTTFTAPTSLSSTDCTMRVTVTDSCGRVAFAASAVPVQQSADLSVTKTDLSDPIRAGDALSYSMTVTNASTAVAAAPSVVLTDTLDANTTLVSTTPSTCTSATASGTTTVTCNLGTLAKGASTTVTINTRSSAAAGSDNFAGAGAQPGSNDETCPTSDLCNRVSVSSSLLDSDTSNNAYVQPTNVVRPGIALVKTVTDSSDPDTIGSLGETLTYGFSVTNTGVLPVTNVRVTDSMLGLSNVACVASLAPGASTTCPLITPTRTYAVKASDILAGSVSNTASAVATPSLGADVVSSSTAVMQTPATPALRLVKSVADSSTDSDTIASRNEKLTYGFTVTNTGNVPMTDVTISDDRLGLDRAACVSTLAVGASTTCPTLVVPQYTTTALDVDNGVVNNTATVGGTAPSGDRTTSPGSASIATEVAKPAMTLSKRVEDANDDGIGQLGEELEYGFTVTNTGNVPLTGVTVSDPMLGLTNATCAATLAVGESTACPGLTVPAYTVSAADIAQGSVANTASSTSKTAGGTSVTATASRTFPTPATPAVKLAKKVTDASGDKIAQLGEQLTYAFTVTNTGNVPLSNVRVTDAMVGLDDAVCASSLAVGASTTCPAMTVPAHTVSGADIAKGSVDNTATVAGTSQGATVTGTDSATLPAPALPSVSLATTVKDASGNAIAEFGEKLTYTFTVVNNGNVPMTDVTISDSRLGLDKAPCVASLAVGASTTCPLLTVPASAVTDDDIDAQTIDNTARANGATSAGAVTDAKKVSIATEGDKPAVTLVKKVADSRDPDAAAVAGERLTYQFVVSNVGNVRLLNVRVTDPTLGIDRAPCADVLRAGRSTTCTVAGSAYTVGTSDVDAGRVPNTATVNAATARGKSVSDKSTVSLVVLRNPALSLDKTVADSDDEDAIGSLGESLTYTFKVTNTGDTTLSGVTVSDAMLGLTDAPCVATLAPGRTSACPQLTVPTHLVSADDIARGSVDNTATAAGAAAGGTRATATDSASIATPAQPALRLDLQVTDGSDADSVGGLGEDLTYTFTVANIGNVPLTGVTVTDPMLGLDKAPCVDALAVGESVTCTITPNTHRVTADDIAAGRVDNSARASAKPSTGGDPVGAAASVSIGTDVPRSGLTVLQQVADSDDPDSVGALGEKLTYTFQVANTGNVTLTNVTLTDPRLGLDRAPCVSSLAPGATATCTLTPTQSSTTVTGADIDKGSVTNTVTASGSAPGGGAVTDESTTTIDTPALPRLELVKTVRDSDDADAIASIGEKVTYAFSVTNSGNTPVADVTITDARLGLDAAPCVASLAIGATTTCPLLTVPAYTTTAADLVHGSVDNTATVTGKPSSGGTVTRKGSAMLLTQSVLPSIGITATVTDASGDQLATTGERLTYTFTVTNNGNLPLRDVTITDPKLGLKDARCAASLAVGESTTCPLLTVPTYVTTAADQRAGKVDNVVTANATPVTGGTVGANDTATIATKSTQASVTMSMQVTDSADADTSASVGEVLTYAFTVTNNGTETLADVTVSAPKLGVSGVACASSLAPGQSVTCSIRPEYTTTADDARTGSVVATATVRATGSGGTAVSASASASIPTVGGEFDYDWEYPPPSCDGFTVTYPANIPDGQANDVNMRFRRADGTTFTLNFHNNDGFWGGTTTFAYRSHPQWPGGLDEWTIEWTQVGGTNYHWEGAVTCRLNADGTVTGVTGVAGWNTAAARVTKGRAVADDAITVYQAGTASVVLEKRVDGVWKVQKSVPVIADGTGSVDFPTESTKGTFAYRLRIDPTDRTTGYTTPVRTVTVT